MPDNAKRIERLTILLTAGELAELKRRAGLVALGPWIRAKLLGVAEDGVVTGAEKPAKKFGKPATSY